MAYFQRSCHPYIHSATGALCKFVQPAGHTSLVTCAQKAHHRSTHQLTRIPHSFSWTRLSCGPVNQADEVESIGHGRELAADSVPGKKESAIELGDENAIEAPRNYNELSVNGNKPLNSVSQSRGAPHYTPTQPLFPPRTRSPAQAWVRERASVGCERIRCRLFSRSLNISSHNSQQCVFVRAGLP